MLTRPQLEDAARRVHAAMSDAEVKAAVRHYYSDTHNLIEGAGAAEAASR